VEGKGEEKSSGARVQEPGVRREEEIAFGEVKIL
jgi:hypothetical protein